jgi:hypothetical protein
LFKQLEEGEIHTPWCQKPSEREEAEEGDLFIGQNVYVHRQVRASPRCCVLPGGWYGCIIPTLLAWKMPVNDAPIRLGKHIHSIAMRNVEIFGKFYY